MGRHKNTRGGVIYREGPRRRDETWDEMRVGPPPCEPSQEKGLGPHHGTAPCGAEWESGQETVGGERGGPRCGEDHGSRGMIRIGARSANAIGEPEKSPTGARPHPRHPPAYFAST